MKAPAVAGPDDAMTTCIGLDAHTKTCTYRVKDHEGNLLDGNTIPSTRQESARPSLRGTLLLRPYAAA